MVQMHLAKLCLNYPCVCYYKNNIKKKHKSISKLLNSTTSNLT